MTITARDIAISRSVAAAREGALTLRPDGRFEVPAGDFASPHGCAAAFRCVLAEGHHGACTTVRTAAMAGRQGSAFSLHADGSAGYRCDDISLTILPTADTEGRPTVRQDAPHPMRWFIPTRDVPVLATLIRGQGTPQRLDALPAPPVGDILVADLQDCPHLQASDERLERTILEAAGLR